MEEAFTRLNYVTYTDATYFFQLCAQSSCLLASGSQVLRDGRWNEEDAMVLVPGDIISIKLGDIVPADARLLEGDALKIDQVWIQSLVQVQFDLKTAGHECLDACALHINSS